MADTAAVARFLEERFDEPIPDVALIGAGEWAHAFAFALDGQELVIRIGAYRDDFDKDVYATRFGTAALRIPRVTEIGEAFEGWYAISERAHGVPLDTLGEAEMRDALPQILGVLDQIREADVESSQGFGQWDATGNAPYPSWPAMLMAVGTTHPHPRVSGGWRDSLESSPTGAQPFDDGFACLAELAPRCPSVRTLVHADFLNRNVLVDRGQVTAVLDWGCSLYGDFVYDLATLAFAAPWFPAWRAIDVRGEIARHLDTIGLDVPDFETRLRACELHVGLDAQAYQALTGRFDDLALSARLTLEAADRV